MDDKLITGVIRNMDTGEETEMEHYALFPDYGLTSIVLVQGIECHGTDPDDCKEIAVNCKALDCIGMVYDLNMTFTAETSQEKTALLLDMEVNSVHLVCGRYAFMDNEPIVLHDPEYRSVEPDFSEVEVRAAFRINEKHKRCH
ncbi:MAG: hypothetical protein ACOYOS_16780 [Syntrophales bacterium]